MKNNPSVPMREIRDCAQQLLSDFVELQYSLHALRLALFEKIPGFEQTYEKHYRDVAAQVARSHRPQALAKLLEDFDELIRAFEESSGDEKKS